MGKIRTIVSNQKNIRMKAHEIAGEVECVFPSKAYLYVIMDDEVALGLYENGTFQIRLASGKRMWSIPWEYVREIAIFSENQELKLCCFGDEYRGRLRVDDAKQGQNMYIMDEAQKLWGTIREESEGWSLLSSLRGTKIWVPVIFNNHEKVEKTIGILVRRYMDFPDASEKRGLIHCEDERFLEFCPWPQEGGGKDELFYQSL